MFLEAIEEFVQCVILDGARQLHHLRMDRLILFSFLNRCFKDIGGKAIENASFSGNRFWGIGEITGE
ncbi:hypothetical protein HNR44_000307 [Geomicrobium halophilum]|uniref:Uncharacterized protein n=1 Tax=Geomicrobium halophilum TaxID=549000 RepID=A0A841PZU0_9BACL|nr:hypothetical protein [Geomicrobium halophilum]